MCLLTIVILHCLQHITGVDLIRKQCRSAVDFSEGDMVQVTDDVFSGGINMKGTQNLWCFVN